MLLILTFDSGDELVLEAEPAAFRSLATELDEQSLSALSESVRANTRLLRIDDADRAAVGRAVGAMIAHL